MESSSSAAAGSGASNARAASVHSSARTVVSRIVTPTIPCHAGAFLAASLKIGEDVAEIGPGPLSQEPVDQRCWESQPFELPRGGLIGDVGLGAPNPVVRRAGPRGLRDLGQGDALARGVAIDPALHKLTDEAGVADRRALRLDVERREQLVVEQPVALARGDRRRDRLVVEALPL